MTQPPMPAPVRRPVWPWILGGCLLLLLVVVVGAFALWQFGVRQVTDAVTKNVTDPKYREATAKKLMRAESLPSGWHPLVGSFDIPLVVHVRLTDKPQDGASGYGERGFVYTESMYADDSVAYEKFFTGAADAPAEVENVGVKVSGAEELARSVINLGEETIRYRAINGHLQEGDFSYDGPLALMWVDCPGEKKERTAVWFGPEATDVAGLQKFMEHFHVCKPRP